MNTNPITSHTEKYGVPTVSIIRTVALNPQAELAERILATLAIAACQPADGENKDGSQKFRLLTPTEAADRACDIAECAYAKFIARNWLVEIPPPKNKAE